MNGGAETIFREEQRFRQPWLWLLIVPLALSGVGVFGWGLYQQLILGRPFGDRPMSDEALVATAVLVILLDLGLVALFLFARLEVEVRRDGLSYRFFPFHFRAQRLGAGSIAGHEAVTYRPLRDYGGWGVRYGRAGKAYNVSGNRGVRMRLAGGKSLLIGSQRPEELALALESVIGRRG